MSLFTPEPKLAPDTNPRDWAYELACLPVTANIVFTKASFLSFLKTHAIDVSPNYVEINKLPRYAQIGTLTAVEAAPATEVAPLQPAPVQQATAAPAVPEWAAPVHAVSEQKPVVVSEAPIRSASTPVAAPAPELPRQRTYEAPAASTATGKTQAAPGIMHNPSVVDVDGHEFRPTRRVREPIGGGSALVSALFGTDDEHADVLAEAERENARRRGLLRETQQTNVQRPTQPTVAKPMAKTAFEVDQEAVQNVPNSVFRPTRRVREPGGTGGSSTIALG